MLTTENTDSLLFERKKRGLQIKTAPEVLENQATRNKVPIKTVSDPNETLDCVCVRLKEDITLSNAGSRESRSHSLRPHSLMGDHDITTSILTSLHFKEPLNSHR